MTTAEGGNLNDGQACEPFDLMLRLEARLRAARTEWPVTRSQSWTGLAFRLGERWLLAPCEEVREVIPPPPLTRVPGARPWLRGIANFRGAPLPVTDLGALLDDAEPVAVAHGQRIMVFNSNHLLAGILVDEVAGHRVFSPSDQHHELSKGAGAIEPYLLGAFRREGRDWLVLSLHKLTRSPTFVDAGLSR